MGGLCTGAIIARSIPPARQRSTSVQLRLLSAFLHANLERRSPLYTSMTNVVWQMRSGPTGLLFPW